ncbi:MAG: sigma-70 family RNA polymerase sigma factor, partial [[Eubacterium] siraeum]|nr:sigma-70 family RNA polymerase sigma factor [[Eubacterium] siraeum]
MVDGEIVELFWQRSENAITSAAERYQSYLTTIAYNILGSKEDAEECVNEAYLKAWNAIPPARPKLLAPFLGKIVKNFALTRLRADSAQKRGGGEKDLIFEELAECIPDSGSVEEQAESKELEQVINAFLKSLSKKNRIIFM